MSAQPHEDAGVEPGKGRAHEIHFKVDGESYLIMREDDILGIIG